MKLYNKNNILISISKGQTTTCASGIHFFLNKESAEKYYQ